MEAPFLGGLSFWNLPQSMEEVPVLKGWVFGL